MLAVFVALRSEQACVQRHLERLEDGEVEGFPLVRGQYGGKTVILCRTGIGGQRAEAAARAILDQHTADAVLSLGFAGGVVDGLAVGDTVLCEKVYLQGGAQGQASHYFESDPQLLELAVAAGAGSGIRYRDGNSATVSRALAKAEEKRRFGEANQVAIVEMESYYIGRAAAERSIPFLCVRAVTDSVSDELPLIGMVKPDGLERPWRAFPYLLRRPNRALWLARWARNWRKAIDSLSAFSGVFLTLWSEKAR